jgi:uncharacterized protein (DUF2235 family)
VRGRPDPHERYQCQATYPQTVEGLLVRYRNIVNEHVRNLVVCLDGTDNQFCATNTNVVRMLQSLAQDPQRQLAYYDPGVGTIWEEGTLSRTAQKVQMILGLAFGLGVTRNVAQAYEFLMRYHRPDDRIFIFGFSRGALEARALAGLIHRCGLLYEHLPSLTPYALRLFQTPGEFSVIDEFKATFSRRVDIGFLGVWDTVTSMGNVWSPIHWPNTAKNPSVEYVAHAIAIDERRAFFRQNRWSPTPRQVCSEVWFPGVHSDVGGGYPADDGRLWAIAFEWMAKHAEKAGLDLDAARLQHALDVGSSASTKSEEDYASKQHDSLTWAWKPLELVPKFRRQQKAQAQWESHWILPARHAGFSGRPRTLKRGERVHRSAIQRFVARDDYRPATLTEAGMDADKARAFLATSAEEWIVGEKTAALA